jgi:hypothetical protein
MLDVTYPLFGGLLLLTSITASCLARRISHLSGRIAVLENQRVAPTLVPAPAPVLDPQPQPQHVAIYIPPPPSAPPALPPNMYYDDRVRTAVI